MENSQLKLPAGKRILVVGASGDIGRAVVRLFASSNVLIGAHYFSNPSSLESLIKENNFDRTRIRLFQADLSRAEDCAKLVDSFVEWAGGIDALVQLCGDIKGAVPWDRITEREWKYDIGINLSAPFFLSQGAIKHMKENGGKIILTSTASAKHGGGIHSIGYGLAKAGVEFLVKVLARVGADYNILVNGIAPGFIKTQFHTVRLGKTEGDIKKRVEKIPLKRAGKPEDIAGMIAYLLSDWGNFITGECIPISGGDWL
jgi:NAD(P)-dependent dehydrogenase (short-subunit alcohol dehydrogenase family)